ncbi:sialin-like isoform X2 [Varroa jacobsoni]|uniref:sialin-like isoform X2 n=1 Tax=Varroa jacobsoni TaxID=62625 RepID=UPI000BF8425E|nr:sialin-like isoform X2 [Varroa jacobsoni]
MAECCIPIRYLVSLMVFFAFVLDQALRSCLSITVLVMVNRTHGAQPLFHGPVTHMKFFESARYPQNRTSLGDPRNWNTTTQGWVLNSVYIGILFSQLPAGHLVESFSLKWVLGYGVFFMSLLQFVSPLVISWSVWAFVALRIVAGLCIGSAFPSANALMSRWSPVHERTLLITLATLGYGVGATVTMFIAGPLCKHFGACGVIWSLLWYVCVASSPEKHRWISEEERVMTLANRDGNFDQNRHIPWKAILTSGPTMVFCIRTFCSMVFGTIFSTYTPIFLDHMYNIDLTVNGWINGISNMLSAIVALICSIVADRLLQSGYSINKVRKTFSTLSLMLPASIMLLLAQLEADVRLVAGLIIFASTLWGLYGGSDPALPIDLTAEFSGAVSAVVNTYANLAAVLTPIIVGWFLADQENFFRWNVIFETGAFTAMLGAGIFLVLGSASRQNWPTSSEDEAAPLLVDPL